MWYLRMFLHFRHHLLHPVNPQLHRLWFDLLLPHRYRPRRHAPPPPPPLPRPPPLSVRPWMQPLTTTPRRITTKRSNLMISIRLRITTIGKFWMEIVCQTNLVKGYITNQTIFFFFFDVFKHLQFCSFRKKGSGDSSSGGEKEGEVNNSEQKDKDGSQDKADAEKSSSTNDVAGWVFDFRLFLTSLTRLYYIVFGDLKFHLGNWKAPF